MKFHASVTQVKLTFLLLTIALLTFACSDNTAPENIPKPATKSNPEAVTNSTPENLKTTVHTGRYIDQECTDGHKGGKYMETKGYEIIDEDGQYFVFDYSFYCNEDNQGIYQPAGLESAQYGGYPEKTHIVRYENNFSIGENITSQMVYSTDGKNIFGYVSSEARSKYEKLIVVVEAKKETLTDTELERFDNIKELVSPGGKIIMSRIPENNQELAALFLQGQELYQTKAHSKK